MTGTFATTPFGGAPMNAALFSLNHRLAERRDAVKAGDAGNDTSGADKWKLVNALGAARHRLGLSDRTIAVLTALLSVLPGRTIDLAAEQIVFPSNAELSRRTAGMADATLRRHIAALVSAGLLARRDSPNGKRYARRSDTGQIEAAFGFDLGPLAMRAAEIFALEDEVKAEELLCRRLRDEISVHIRDIVKILDAALEAQRAGDWHGFGMRLLPLGRRLRRTAPIRDLAERRDALLDLRRDVEKSWLDGLSKNDLNKQDMSANDLHFERQLQNSNTESTYESAIEDKKKEPEPGKVVAPELKGRAAAISDERLPALSGVLAVCPQIADYAKDGIGSWHDLIVATNLVRSMLGVSPDAWRRAQTVLGTERAAIVIAAMLERADKIRSAGGYLRALTQKAENRGFSVRPMLEALGRG